MQTESRTSMLIYLLAFVGGILTILSPCILPVLPFVFARADQPFRRSGLPLLAGMALTFSVVAIAAAFGGHWVVRLNQGGRYVAMLVFLVLGITLLFPSLAEALTRPLVRAGGRFQGGPTTESSIGKSFVLGISTGLLWAPCAGPILGLILTGAAIQGPGAHSSFLLLSFALGATTSLGIALFADNKAFSAMKRSLAFEVWIRRSLGVAVIMDHGSDTDANGVGTVEEHRLYQLIRQNGAVEDRTFEIEFLDPGVQAFAFTFG